MASRAEAVEALTEVGLSEYEARCFVALTQLSTGTAKEISQLADVPQSRVYDVTDQLHRKGLIDIQQSDPKKYFALPIQPSIERLRRGYHGHLETASEFLQSLESREADDGGVWEIANREDVRNRVVMHVENATNEIYLLASDEALLEDGVVEALRETHDRGVRLLIEVSSDPLRDELDELLPDARIAVTDFSSRSPVDADQNPGRLLLVDQETVLLSARQEGLVPNHVEEPGVWGSAVGRGLIAWIRLLLETRREQLAFETSIE